MTRTRRREPDPRRGGDTGAALVEFTLVAILLFMIVFGIIGFGLILSFKQDMTRAAAEGARAGAVALPVGAQTPAEAARIAAEGAVKEAVLEFGGSFASDDPDDPDHGCQRPGMSCEMPVVAPCAAEPSHQCVTVRLTYDYDDQPLYGRLPFIDAVLPNTVTASSVARINE